MPKRSLMNHLVFGIALCMTASVASAQAETCDGTEVLGGSAMLPLDLNFTPASDDFTLTGSSCTDSMGATQDDTVVCVTPESECFVDVSCSLQGIQLPTTLNIFQNTCTTNPATCVGSNANGSDAAQLTSVFLPAATQTCFVCQGELAEIFGLNLDIVQAAGSDSCGSLPVTLQSFSVGSE